MGFFSSLFGCENNGNSETNTPLLEITSRMDTAEGWNDIVLTIESNLETDSTHIYIAKGLYEGKTVGLKCEMKKGIKAGIVNGEMSGEGFIARAVTLSSIGAESDSLVTALSILYRFPTKKPFTKNPISTTAFSLNQMDVDLKSKNAYKFKLFLEEDSDTLYSEIFFNVELGNRTIELSEKDESYRENIIQVLTKA
jgi:hypothetical protein